jgi:hypothetical protein
LWCSGFGFQIRGAVLVKQFAGGLRLPLAQGDGALMNQVDQRAGVEHDFYLPVGVGSGRNGQTKAVEVFGAGDLDAEWFGVLALVGVRLVEFDNLVAVYTFCFRHGIILQNAE